MNKSYPPVYYADYLQLNKLLNAQELKSLKYKNPSHDEMLFIIIHQVYELWFKQIIHELDSVNNIFQEEAIDERDIAAAVSRIGRINEIQRYLIDQLHLLETIAPLDYLEFRDYLIPASGFQSYQFRLIENKLGLKSENRVQHDNLDFYNALSEEHRRLVLDSIESMSLFELVEKWLERTPFLKSEGFNFWEVYKQTVETMLEDDTLSILNNPPLPGKKKEIQIRQNDTNKEYFEALFSRDKYNELIRLGLVRLSLNATRAAIFINLYRDEPILHIPYKFLNSLIKLDEKFSNWRYKHALLVHRTIGSKVGTCGSAGYSYLMQTVDKHRVFADLFNLSTYLIPRSRLPEIPEDLEHQLGFYYSHK